MDAGLADTRDVTLAVAPHGTGNDWARSLGCRAIPRSIARCDRRRPHPAARRRRDRLPGAAATRAAGSSTSPARATTPRSRRTCRGRCRPPSPTSASRCGGSRATGRPSSRSPPTTRTIDGRLLLAFVANAQYCGNRMHVVPTAGMDDGLLDVLAVRDLSLLQALPKLGEALWRAHPRRRAVRHLRAARVRIETRPAGDRSRPTARSSARRRPSSACSAGAAGDRALSARLRACAGRAPACAAARPANSPRTS